MKGLLLKDYYVIRSSLYIQLITLLFIGIGLSIVVSPEIFIILSIMTLGLYSSSSIASDKSYKWDMYSRTIPISRNTVISSKYVLNLLMVFLGLILGITLIMITTIFTGTLDTEKVVAYALLGISLNFLSSSVNIPASIVFDSSKQFLTMLLSIVFTIFIFLGALGIVNQFINVKDNLVLFVAITTGISTIVYIVSWLFVPNLIGNRDL